MLLWTGFNSGCMFEVRHSLSISLLVRSSNLGNFLNLREFANFSASCFLLKDAFYDFIYFSISIISSLGCLSSACIFFGVFSLCRIWLSSASGKLFARSYEGVAESSFIINKERIKYLFFFLGWDLVSLRCFLFAAFLLDAGSLIVCR